MDSFGSPIVGRARFGADITPDAVVPIPRLRAVLPPLPGSAR